MNKIRINKYIACNSEYSRRQVDELIRQGEVFVNGRTASLGQIIEENQKIEIFGASISKKSKRVLIAYHKPIGVITTTDQRKRDNIVSKIDYDQRIYPIGRLDVGTSGLILLTNCSKIKRAYENPYHKVEKEYIVKCDRNIDERVIDQIKKGVKINDYVTLPAKVYKISDKLLNITIIEGKNRQIRRMMETLGYKVVGLHRIRVGEIKLGALKRGKWRLIKNLKISC